MERITSPRLPEIPADTCWTNLPGDSTESAPPQDVWEHSEATSRMICVRGWLCAGERRVQGQSVVSGVRPNRLRRVRSCVRVIPRSAAACVLLPLAYARATKMARFSRLANASGAEFSDA